MKVVIIEDEEDLGLLIKNYLCRRITSGNGDHVVIAKNLGEGLEVVERTNPDWIIMDNNLPDGRGVNIIDDLKTRAAAARIVMMSALTNLKEEALHKGADFFLDKPISFAEIKAIMHQ